MAMNNQRGIIKTIVIVVVGIVLLSYFGIDLEQATKSALLKKNVSYTWKVIETVWSDYVYGPIARKFIKKSDTSTETTSTIVP